MRPLTLLAPLAALTPDLVPPRVWLVRLAFLGPGTTATRWPLIGDLICLVAVGATARRPHIGLLVALGAGFAALNLVSMAVTDFYLGLALFHLAVGVTTAAVHRRTRWAGLTLVVLALLLGVLT